MQVLSEIDDTVSEADHAKGALSLTGLRKSFGAVVVIDDLELDIRDGEFIVFVGPSGCGKSTLLRMIAGLEETTAGNISIGGRNVTNVPASKRGVAMVFQSYALYPHMTVRQNMAFGLKIARTPVEEVRLRIEDAAKKLHITELLDRRPGQLSGGQRQRVAIGRAIVREPLVFLFDEPLSNLDAELRVGMRIEIARLHRELGNTMIYVTHDQTEAMTLADRIVVLRDGHIEQVGTPRQIYEDPANTFVAGFIGSPRMNLLPGKWLGGGIVEVGGCRFKAAISGDGLADGEPVLVGIRPEHLTSDDQFEFTVPFQIDATEYLGGTRFVYGQTPDGQSMIAEIRSGADPEVGSTLTVSAQLDYLRFFSKEGTRLRKTGKTEALSSSPLTTKVT